MGSHVIRLKDTFARDLAIDFDDCDCSNENDNNKEDNNDIDSCTGFCAY